MDALTTISKIHHQATDLKSNAQNVAQSCHHAASAQKKGVSLLHAKYSTLLRYNLNLSRLALARLRGEPIAHLAEKLVEDSVALTKLRPLEKKLQHHIDLLLTSASAAASDPTAALRPNPSAIVFDPEEQPQASDAVYKPPRLAEVVYDARGAKAAERAARDKQRRTERALQSADAREMLAELHGLPEQVDDGAVSNAANPHSNRAMRKFIREDAKRTRFEENNLTRLVVTKKDRKRRRELSNAANAAGADGADGFRGLSDLADRVVSRGGKKPRPKSSGSHADNEIDKLAKLDDALGND